MRRPLLIDSWTANISLQHTDTPSHSHDSNLIENKRHGIGSCELRIAICTFTKFIFDYFYVRSALMESTNARNFQQNSKNSTKSRSGFELDKIDH